MHSLKKCTEVLIGQWPDLTFRWHWYPPLCMGATSNHMFERLKPRKDCKRAANASRHTPNRDSGQTWSRKVGQVWPTFRPLGRNLTLNWPLGHLGQGHEISRVGVKLINARVLKVTSRSVAFLHELFAKKKNFRGLHQTLPPVPRELKLLVSEFT